MLPCLGLVYLCVSASRFELAEKTLKKGGQVRSLAPTLEPKSEYVLKFKSLTWSVSLFPVSSKNEKSGKEVPSFKCTPTILIP